ncbi:hypothetical protein [Actinomadura decatromicini]|uniref:Uncharacterized protein n=1 Tax=Actinomadura decatromicini TaxID=2604572 RepID=A0A5D3FC58_9ACTN|nr:hypothetical protein [Actinomadura decatromicini]TYK45783.1 hypothetical protein FXF68_26440 [Actinomadura decatromicini]
MSAADVREFLRLSPPEMLRAVLETVRLRDAKRLPPGADKLILRTMRQGESKRRAPLRFLMGGLWLHGLRNSDELDAADCAALLDAGTAAEVLARAPGVRMLVEFEAPEALMRWGLVRAVLEDRPLAVVALGLLAAEPDDRALPAVRDMWTACRDAHPELPARPAGLAELREAIRRGSSPRPEDLVTELDGLRDRFAAAADAADRAAGSLREGRRPDDADLKLIKGAVADYDGVRRRIGAVLPGEHPADLPALASSVRDAVSALLAGDRLRALRGLQGPEFVAELLDEVRQAADGDADGDDGAGLAVLAELIEAMGVKEDRSEVPALAGRARTELPDRWHPLVDVALMGGLTVEDVPDGATPPSAEQPPAAPPSADPPTGEQPSTGQTSDEPPPAEPSTSEQSSAVPSEEAVDVPAPRKAPDDEPPGEDAAEMSALDAFLEETIPAARARPERSNPTRPKSQAAPDELPERQPSESVDVDSRGLGKPDLVEGAEDVSSRHQSAVPGEDDASQQAADLLAAEGAALGAGRFGLAGWIRKTAGRPDAEVHARWCAALASGMAVFAGPLTAEFAALAAGLDAKALAEDPAGGVLAWAAAIRAGLVYPDATRLVEGLNVVVSAHPVLKECGEAFALAARAGVYLSPGMDGWIRGAAGLAEARRTASQDAARLLEEAPHRTVKLARATEVWKALVLKDGEIGRLLTLAAGDDPAGADAAAAEVVRLRAGTGVDRLIDETDARVNGRKKGKPIIAGARATLHKWIDGALGAVGAWAAAVKEHGDGGPDSRDWRTVPLRQLRETIEGHRAAADEALVAMADKHRLPTDVHRFPSDAHRLPADAHRPPTDAHRLSSDAQRLLIDANRPASEAHRLAVDPPATWQPAAAALEGARGLLAESFALLDGRPLPTTEPPAARLLNLDLLAAVDVPLDPRTLHPLGEVSAERLAEVALAGPPDWAAVFEARAARLDHEGTEAVVAALESVDPEAAARLRARQEELVREARTARDGRVERVRARIATSRRDGLLTEGEERAGEETLNRLTAASHDFDRVQDAPNDLLAQLFEKPDHYDAHSYRMAYRDGPDRAPLSIGQITGLLRAERLVHVVTGSAAMHAERVVRSLEDMPAELPGLALRSVRPGDGTLEAALRRARGHGGHDVILVDLHAPHYADQFERRLAEARAAVADESGEGTLSVVLVAGPASAPAWLRCASADDVELVPLRRFDPPAVRQWMLEDSLGFPDDAGQRELVRRTGGWPALVGRVVTGIAGRGGDRDQALDVVLRQVRARPTALLDDTGVRADECLAAAWRELVNWDGRETPEDFAALLAASGEQGTAALTSDTLRARAYTGTRDLVDALRTLGALESAGGLLACEPVLAEATRWADQG